MRSYAISAFCIHNAQQNFLLPKAFYESYAIMKRVWKDALPIRTTCIRVTRFNREAYVRRLHEVYMRYIRKREVGAIRAKDGRQLLNEIELTRLTTDRTLQACQ
jgi:hypothetical protein